MKRFAALILAGALFVTGCGGAAKIEGGAKGTVNLTIATMGPLSGGAADLGESQKFGAEMALKDTAAELEAVGLKVTHLAMDDQGKPEQGTQLAEQLIAKKEVVGVVGALLSGVTIAVSQKLAPENLVMLSPANTANAVTDRKLANVNRVVARDDAQGPAAVKFIQEKLGAKSVFVIHDKTAYGQGLADEVKKSAEKAGLKVAAFEGINLGDKDFTAVLTKVKAANPDAIFYGGMYAEAAQIVKQAKEKGVTAKFIGADGLDAADMVKLAGDAANGVYYTSTSGDVSKTTFAPKYQEFAKKPADGFAAYSYDAATVIADALISYAKANPGKTPTRKEVSELVRKTTGFKGVAAQISFDEKGDNKEAKVYIYQYQNAKYPGVPVQ